MKREVHSTVLRNAQVFAPEKLGRRDIWVSGDRIAALDVELPNVPAGFPCDEIDLSGLYVVPGFIDSHVHLVAAVERPVRRRVPPVELGHLTKRCDHLCGGAGHRWDDADDA